ncbi:hypothetical protein F0U62_01545 [Cystobacter fuscus]|uniref:hypothetical protein n=1 Tax=Cystobacter fuscus TaxID=43 RepID=UPI002B29410C|nr:hypothetical protein F0U62_01545 [Cystobacter fuscus]
MSAMDKLSARERLAHALKLQFQLPPDRPTDNELDAILQDVDDFRVRHGRKATEHEWAKIVHRHVRFEGHWRYDGLDFQDLNALFAIIQMQAQGMKR